MKRHTPRRNLREPSGRSLLRASTLNLLLAVLLASGLSTAIANEIGFIERFALAEDRSEVLRELIPGTEDYYFFHALHYQNEGDGARYREVMTQWEKRIERSAQREMLDNRQALLSYETDPEATLVYLKRALNLTFDDQRERRQTDPGLATALDQDLIRVEAIVRESLRDAGSLGEVSAAGIDWLMRHWNEWELSVAQEREVLRRLERPDYPHLVGALAKELGRRESGGFGEFPIYRQLLLEQLDALEDARPDLLENETFVITKLRKLRPGADVDLNRDREAKLKYLEDAWAFVSGLGPANSLKASLLYERLRLGRERGVYDRQRFVSYLKLPRPGRHVNPVYRSEATELWRHPVDLGFDASSVTGIEPIRDDAELERAYLLHFLTGASDYGDFAPYLTDEYLKSLWAEANIVAGVGDSEKWSSLLSPAAYQALRERVDMEFDPTCKDRFAEGEMVRLDLHVKNVRNLIVKIYEINTPNYYRQNERPLNTDLNLDGLVANEELSFDYEESPFLRIKRRFDFPQLDARRGAWVLEFIGNGESSRAMILRGGVQYLTRPSQAGHALRLLDDQGRSLLEGFVWMQGKRYDPGDGGEIFIPFSNKPGRQPIVLQDGHGFASLEHLDLNGEHYELRAGFYVDREQLLAGEEAILAVRPQLLLNGFPADVELLKEVRLTITSRDLDGVAASSTVSDFKLYRHKESTHRFRVPERLATLEFALAAKVENLSQGEEKALSASEALKINEMATTEAVADLFLRKVEGGYQIQLLGRSGEPLPNMAVNLNLRRDDFRTDMLTTLRTDETGTIALGAMEGLYRVTATAPNGRRYRWVLPEDRRVYPDTIHVHVGDVIQVPVVGAASEMPVSLLETAYGGYVRDFGRLVSVAEGVLTVKGLPPGDYQLFLRRANHGITLRVAEGQEAHGLVLSTNRNVEKLPGAAMRLASPRVEGEELVIRLTDHDPFARIHLLASRFLPPFDVLSQLGGVEPGRPMLGRPAWAKNLYVSGRMIGDEYRYIIERRYATKYPGNMLERPGLLLNLWELRDTETSKSEAKDGQAWGMVADGAEPAAAARPASRAAAVADEGFAGQQDPHFLEFLAQPGLALYNLAPGDDGEVRVKLKDLGDASHVRVLVVDSSTAVERHVALPPKEIAKVNVRLKEGLNPKRHFTQRDRVTVLSPDEPFVIEDAASAQFEVYDSLASVFRLYRTLSGGDSTLEEFAFLLDWPDLEISRKRALYSQYASHELNFFLQRKDPEFFTVVVLPYLANKAHRTFMDHYLLDEDVSAYLDPWHYARLNVVERVLLADRLPEQRRSITRDVREALETLPIEMQLGVVDFDVALGGTVLEGLAEGQADRGLSGLGRSMRGRRGGNQARFGVMTGWAEGEVADKEVTSETMLADGMLADDRLARRKQTGFFRQMESTKEWAENYYHHVRIEEQNADLVPVNKFWRDFAVREDGKPFVSPHLAEAAGNSTEMLLALAVLELPFQSEGGEGQAVLEDGAVTLKPSAPAVLYHKEVSEAAAGGPGGELLVSQHFFRNGERYEEINGERRDRFVTDEFLVGEVYGAHVVVTNPTSSRQRLELLQQIPVGAIPVKGSKVTENRTIQLEPYQTHTQETFFYFLKPGDYSQYPVHVAKGEDVVGFADPFTFRVVDELSTSDTSSWAYLSQWGSEEEVLTYLSEHNLRRTDLSRIAWRCRESEPFFLKVIDLLQARHHYSGSLYRYALYHHHREALRDYLHHADAFLARVGDALESSLITIDPIERRSYQHLEYSPLVNARRYRLGGTREIFNERFHQQYEHLMRILSQRRHLDDEDCLSVVIYLLLQDRVEEALALHERVEAEALPTQLQHDYLRAYLAFYREDLSTARSVAQAYQDHPVDRWRERFSEILRHLKEIERPGAAMADADGEEAAKAALTEPSFTFKVENRKIDLLYRNLEEIQVNYYRMDLEFLFSTNPFMNSDNARFSMIKPNRVERHALNPAGESLALSLPAEFEGENVLVEVVGAGIRKSTAYYSNRLNVQVAAQRGQLRVTEQGSDRPLGKVYVKVYADLDGQPKFYKDGYTDLRGRFDYASLNTDELDQAQRFGILVMSEGHGALVQETVPPRQ